MIAAVVLIRAVPGDVPALARRLAGIEGVAEVYSVSGEYDLIAIVRVQEYDRIAAIVTEEIAQITGIERTNTLTAFRDEAADNSILMGNDDIDLRFGGLSASGCGNYVSSQGDAAAPSCVYLIRAEERWGNGDGILSVAEQTRIADASLLRTLRQCLVTKNCASRGISLTRSRSGGTVILRTLTR
jgi:hypothetical protein